MTSHFSFKDLRACGIKAIRIAAGLILVIDAIAKPFYRPLINWFASQEIVKNLEATVARLPRWAILFLFGIPFIIAEPAKVYALILMTNGNFIGGLLLLILSYLATFLIVERIYHAGRDKLLSYRWLGWFMGHVTTVRDWLQAQRRNLRQKVTTLFRR